MISIFANIGNDYGEKIMTKIAHFAQNSAVANGKIPIIMPSLPHMPNLIPKNYQNTRINYRRVHQPINSSVKMYVVCYAVVSVL